MSIQELRSSAPVTTAWTSYRRMQTLLTERLNRELAEQADLSRADLEVLVALSEYSDEPVRDRVLRCELEWEKSRLSHQLRRMEQRGLVSRGNCVEDNRSSTATLTEAGRSAAVLGKKVEADVIARYMESALTPEQLANLGAMADAVLANMEEALRA